QPALVVEARADALRSRAVVAVVDDLRTVLAAHRVVRDLALAVGAGRGLAVILPTLVRRQVLGAALRLQIDQKEPASRACPVECVVQSVAFGAMHCMANNCKASASA